MIVNRLATNLKLVFIMLCSRTSLTKTSSGSGLCQGTLTGNGYNQKENPEEQKRRNKDLIGKVRVFSISLKLFLHDGDAGSYLNILIYRDFSCSHTLLVRNYYFAIFFLFFCFVLFFVDGITKKKKKIKFVILNFDSRSVSILNIQSVSQNFGIVT